VDRASLGAAALALAFIALHLPFLPESLEDLDSINFALGIRDFDVARHQPHPPGYPIFILAAKAAHAIVPSEARALTAIGICAGGLAALALVRLFEALEAERPAEDAGSLTVALLILTSPLFWFTAARPLSDVAGLAAALTVQALTLTARTRRGLIAASACAALAAGIRSQVAWLSVPLLILRIARWPRHERRRAGCGVALAYVAGVLVWAVPLVALTGPAAYFRVVFNQGSEDLSGVVMLWTTPTVRQLGRALQSAFVAPWGFVPLAVLVLVFAVVGLARMARAARPVLTVLAVAFGPYLIFDLLFQETATTRYALPIVVPVAYLAVRGASRIPSGAVMPAIVALAGFDAFTDTTALAGYSRMPAPAFRLLTDMRAAVSAGGTPRPPPVMAMHRREEFDMRRPIIWVGDQMPLTRRLAAPAKHEWLEVVKYWNEGGRAPVWFIADPPRSDLALFSRQRPPARYRWPFAPLVLIGGVRPGEMDWHVIEPPDWYLGEGWAITPETAGVAREDDRGPGRGGVRGWIRRWPGQATLMVGGRNLADAGRVARVRIAIDGRTIDEAAVAPGFFLRMLTVAPTSLSGPGDYATVTVDAKPETASDSSPRPGADVAVEQFDAQRRDRVVFGFGDGWYEQEYDPATGRLWRWTSERAALKVRAEGHALSLRLDGELEAAARSRVVIRAGDRIVAEQDVGRTFSIATAIPAGALGGAEGAITIETSQWYVPAERSWRSRDRRHLGLKIYDCQIAPAS
jgi:hypothetical protein